MGSTIAERGRVAVVSHGFFPTVGGSERYHLFTARALSEFARVEVFTSSLNLAAGSEPSAGGTPVGPLVVHYLPSRSAKGERLVRPVSLWRALRSFRPHVVWGNHPSPTADFGALYAIVTRRPWVATYHADVGSDRWWKRRYLAWEMRLLRKARLVFVTSERYREALATRGVRRERIVAVAPGPYIGDGSLPVVPPEPIRAGAPFLFVGALDAAHAYKRLDQLLAAVADVTRAGVPIELEVVGDGDRRAEFERQAKELGVMDRVRFLGKLSDQDLAEKFARALALVIASPAETEGFGSVAVEAIQYGCPVIVSSRVAVADLLGPAGAAALFDPERPASLAEAIRALATDPHRRSQLSNAARAVAPSLGWASALSKITEPVRQLLPGALPSAGPR